MNDILINDVRPRVQYSYDPAAHTGQRFDFGFPVLDASDLRVAANDAVLDPADYTIEGIGSQTGGTVTISPVLSVKTRISIWRDMPFERVTDFAPGSDLRASVLNAELDRMILLLQQAEALVGDSIRRQPQDIDQTLLLPTVGDRAGRFLAFDQAGLPIPGSPTLPGSFAEFALIYLGAGETAAAPVHRANGTALQPGDLYYDTDLSALMVWDGAAWTNPDTQPAGLLHADGSVAMTGDLDLAGQGLINVSTLNGRDVDADAALLHALVVSGDTIARKMALINAWEIARIDGLSNQGLINTYLDVFTDETGVDLGTSTSETYDSAGDYYTNITTAALISQAAGAVISESEGGAVLDAANAFDGVTSQAAASCARAPTSGPGIDFIAVGKDWGVGVTRTVTAFKVWQSSDEGFFTASDINSALKLQGSIDGTSWVDLYTDSSVAENPGGVVDVNSGITTSTAYRYHRVYVQEGNAGNRLGRIAEVEFYEAGTLDMTLVSNAITAASAPAEIRALIDVEAIDAATAGTDYTLEVSRDGDTTWAAVTLAAVSGNAASRAVYAGTADVSGQPSGTSVKWRFKTFNSKEIRLHRVALQADTTLSVPA
jgi:hypothetical protein